MSYADYSNKSAEYLNKAAESAGNYFSKPSFKKDEEKVGKGRFGKVEVYLNKNNLKSAIHGLSFAAAIVPFTAALIYGASKFLGDSHVTPLSKDDAKGVGTETLIKKTPEELEAIAEKEKQEKEDKLMSIFQEMPYEVSAQESPKRSKGMSLTFTAQDGQAPDIKDFKRELEKRFIGLKIGEDEGQAHEGQTDERQADKYRMLISETEPGKFTAHIREGHISIMPQMVDNFDLRSSDREELTKKLEPFGCLGIQERTSGEGLKELGIRLDPQVTESQLHDLFPDVEFKAQILSDNLSSDKSQVLYMNITPHEARKMLEIFAEKEKQEKEDLMGL